MQDNCGNIYKRARATAGLTQERWSEQLGVSVESVRLYETGAGMPSDEVVTRMIEVAVLPVLGYWHLMNKSRVAAEILPEVKTVPLAQAVVQLLHRIREFDEQHRVRELLSIAEDGQIDSAERDAFNSIVKELDGIVQAAMALKFSEGQDGR